MRTARQNFVKEDNVMPENVYATHRVYGDYVLTGIPNAFNNKTSFWISKKGFTVSLYCFSAESLRDLNEHLDNIKAYISYFDNTVNSKKREDRSYSREQLLDVIQSYAMMIQRNKDYPTVLIDDLEKSVCHVLRANGKEIAEG